MPTGKSIGGSIEQQAMLIIWGKVRF